MPVARAVSNSEIRNLVCRITECVWVHGVTVIQALILGIVQGLTEFLPISSSAHLVIIPWLFRWDEPGLAFDVALHLGTLTAILWFFAPDFARLVRAGFASIVERKIANQPERRIAWLLVLGTLPGVAVGILAESRIEAMFHRPDTPHSPQAMIAMAIAVALLGVALFLAERSARHLREIGEVSVRDTIIIGLAQALAIFPGVSRSGSTIAAGLALGFRREAAARFSFLLAAPIVAGAGLKSLWDICGEVRTGGISELDLVPFAVGFITAAVSGYLCIRVLLRYLQGHSTCIFVYYRWLLAAAIASVALARG
jgi:undecaprenyl-diphosphatase